MRDTGRVAGIAASLASLLVFGASIPGSASAGELAFKGCTTTSKDVGPSGSGACGSQIRTPALGLLNAMAASPDGRSIFTGTGFSCHGLNYEECEVPGSVGAFDRASTTGALAYQGCVGRADACGDLPSLGVIPGMAVSPDSNSLYVASGQLCDDTGCTGANALARIERDPETGTLSYRGCVTGDKTAGDFCTEIPSATADGFKSGLGGPTSVAVSPDGSSVYVASVPDASVATFARNPVTGSLAYEGCIAGDEATGPSGSGACAGIPSASSLGYGLHSGLGLLRSVAVSPDGKTLYTTADADAAVARFARDSSTGALAYRDCITGTQSLGPSGSGACSAIPDARPKGSVLAGVGPMALSPDGASLYAGGLNQSAVVRFERDPSTGALTYRDCITGGKNLGDVCRPMPSPTLDSLQSLAVSLDGKSLYAGGGAVVARLARDPATGALDLSSCVSGYVPRRPRHPVCFPIRHATPDGYDSGLGSISSVVASGGSVYAGAFGDDAVSHMAVAPQTRIVKRPKGRTRKHHAVFRFHAGKPATFECQLKGGHVPSRLRHWRHCGSHDLSNHGRKRYRKLGSGRKVFKVRATDQARTTDPTPAQWRWRIR